jgi:hypothetical protein
LPTRKLAAEKTICTKPTGRPEVCCETMKCKKIRSLKDATTVSISRQEVQLYNANARLQVLKEGEFGQKWIPALTGGAHFKYNDGITTKYEF